MYMYMCINIYIYIYLFIYIYIYILTQHWLLQCVSFCCQRGCIWKFLWRWGAHLNTKHFFKWIMSFITVVINMMMACGNHARLSGDHMGLELVMITQYVFYICAYIHQIHKSVFVKSTYLIICLPYWSL